MGSSRVTDRGVARAGPGTSFSTPTGAMAAEAGCCDGKTGATADINAEGATADINAETTAVGWRSGSAADNSPRYLVRVLRGDVCNFITGAGDGAAAAGEEKLTGTGAGAGAGGAAAGGIGSAVRSSVSVAASGGETSLAACWNVESCSGEDTELDSKGTM